MYAFYRFFVGRFCLFQFIVFRLPKYSFGRLGFFRVDHDYPFRVWVVFPTGLFDGVLDRDTVRYPGRVSYYPSLDCRVVLVIRIIGVGRGGA